MKITREMKEHIKEQLKVEVEKKAKKLIPELNRQFAGDFAELAKIQKERDAAWKEFEQRKDAVLARIRKGSNTEIVSFSDYDTKFKAKTGYGEVDGLLNKVVLKLQYEAKDISQIGEVIASVLDGEELKPSED